jgi:hypothetical protein
MWPMSDYYVNEFLGDLAEAIVSSPHLVPADVVLRMRRLLLRCADIAAKGETPIGVGVDQSGNGAGGDFGVRQSWVDLVAQLPSSKTAIN